MAGKGSRKRQGLGTIMVYVSEESEQTRGGGFQEMKVEELAAGVRDFLDKMRGVLSVAPGMIGAFSLEEFEVSAEVGAGGKVGLLGSGIEASAKGGLKFKFQRKK